MIPLSFFFLYLLGMEDDAEFHEHIFLEKHLEDFPKQGPIRHFMELVICGLSKNPYLSVKQKIEHIEWFQKYFEEKKEFLQEIWDLGKCLTLKWRIIKSKLMISYNGNTVSA